jgi:asparagine synthetase B (glutamine-hydrolysing)
MPIFKIFFFKKTNAKIKIKNFVQKIKKLTKMVLSLQAGILGYHRLEVRGTFDEEIMQPLKHGNTRLICNGDIYNWKEVF